MASLKGDSVEMQVQKEFLESQGYNLHVKDGIPKIADSKYPQSLKLIYLQDIKGWWNYKNELILFDICTEEQFYKRLFTNEGEAQLYKSILTNKEENKL